MDWRERSACLTEDPELFFPIGDAAPARLQEDGARRVCARCEVQERCLAWALETGDDNGILGGLTPRERRSIRRRELV